MTLFYRLLLQTLYDGTKLKNLAFRKYSLADFRENTDVENLSQDEKVSKKTRKITEQRGLYFDDLGGWGGLRCLSPSCGVEEEEK